MTQLTLTHLSRDLIAPVVALDRQCFGQLWSAEQYQREFDSPNSDLLVLFDPAQPRIWAYGCVWAIVDEAHITIVATHPDHRHQGCGKLMVWGLLQAATQRKLVRATLEVKATNQAAINLYQQFGFAVAGRRKKYYPDGQDALILWKNKLQHPASQAELPQIYQQLHQQFQRQNCNLTVALATEINATIGIHTRPKS